MRAPGKREDFLRTENQTFEQGLLNQEIQAKNDLARLKREFDAEQKGSDRANKQLCSLSARPTLPQFRKTSLSDSFRMCLRIGKDVAFSEKSSIDVRAT